VGDFFAGAFLVGDFLAGAFLLGVPATALAAEVGLAVVLVADACVAAAFFGVGVPLGSLVAMGPASRSLAALARFAVPPLGTACPTPPDSAPPEDAKEGATAGG
jgi:hypothetical protein